MSRPVVAQIDLQAVRHNLSLARQANPAAKTMAVVKANAYGHGAIEVAKSLVDLADAFGVASIEEALQLRGAGIELPILLLEGVFEQSELALVEQYHLWMVIHAEHQLAWLDSFVSSHRYRPQVWLKVDTGMHRLGIEPDKVASFIDRIESIAGMPEVVVMTHFACADDPQREENRQAKQRFDLPSSRLTSLSNSAAIFTDLAPENSWQRLGIALYGGTPSVRGLGDLKPAMRLRTEVIALRDIEVGESVGYGASFTANRSHRIATLAIGYADGYPRHAMPGTPVLVNGQEAPIVGRVSMDMITVDVTYISNVQIGTEAVMFGPELIADRVAQSCGTIDYTLFAGLTARVPRRYR
jgi:alanine racemase